jgi:hypothetical protein
LVTPGEHILDLSQSLRCLVWSPFPSPYLLPMVQIIIVSDPQSNSTLGAPYGLMINVLEKDIFVGNTRRYKQGVFQNYMLSLALKRFPASLIFHTMNLWHRKGIETH